MKWKDILIWGGIAGFSVWIIKKVITGDGIIPKFPTLREYQNWKDEWNIIKIRDDIKSQFDKIAAKQAEAQTIQDRWDKLVSEVKMMRGTTNLEDWVIVFRKWQYWGLMNEEGSFNTSIICGMRMQLMGPDTSYCTGAVLYLDGELDKSINTAFPTSTDMKQQILSQAAVGIYNQVTV